MSTHHVLAIVGSYEASIRHGAGASTVIFVAFALLEWNFTLDIAQGVEY